MRELLLDPNVTRAALIVGVAVSLLLRQRQALLPGSALAPGLLAVTLTHPATGASVIASAALGAATVWVIGRRVVLADWLRPALACAAGVLLAVAALAVSGVNPGWIRPAGSGLLAVVAGFLAVDVVTRGVSATVRTMAIAGGVVAIVVVLPAVLFPVLVEAQPTIEGIRYAVSGTLEPLALVLSIAAAAGLRNNLGLRAGGYLSAGLLAIVANSGWHVLMIGLVAVLSHIAVARVAKGRLLLAGRSAMTLHLLVAGLFGWAGLLLAHRVGGSAAAAVSGLAAIPLLASFLPGMIAADMSRTSPLAALVGVTLNTSFVLGTCQLAMEVVGPARPFAIVARGLVALATALTIFAPQLLRLGRLVGSTLWLLEPDPAAELLVAIPRRRVVALGVIVPATAAAVLLAQDATPGGQRLSLFQR